MPSTKLRDWCPLDDVDEVLRQRCVMDEAERTAVCLWIGHTYVFDRGFTYTPRLLVTGSRPSCGKSALLRIIAASSEGGIKLESGTTLPVIRDLRRDGARVTLCLDQMDGMGKWNGEDNKLLNLLCSSCEVGAKVGQKEKVISKKAERFETVFSDVGFPAALGKIGDLPGDAIMSRCIVIRMKPETEDERAKQMPERLRPLPGDLLRAKLRKWLGTLKVGYVRAPKGTLSRTEDIWQPLLAVAQLAGPRWVQRAEQALAELNDPEDGRALNADMKLLQRVWEVTRDLRGRSITGKELDRKLGLNSGVARGKALGKLGLKSKGGADRHYLLADIKDAALRYRLGSEVP
jgi:hypothetical protein